MTDLIEQVRGQLNAALEAHAWGECRTYVRSVLAALDAAGELDDGRSQDEITMTRVETTAHQRAQWKAIKLDSGVDAIIGGWIAVVQALCRDIDRLRPQADAEAWQPTHRHYKGGLYRVIARGRDEADLTSCVIYDDARGETWVRPAAEFDAAVRSEGGVPRFAPLAASKPVDTYGANRVIHWQQDDPTEGGPLPGWVTGETP